MNTRSRFSPAMAGTPLNQRLVENDYLSHRDYQSTQTSSYRDSSALSHSTYRPPALLAPDDDMSCFQESPLHSFYRPLSFQEQHSYSLSHNQSDPSPCWSTHGFMCCQCIRTNELGILENWGQFHSILAPGFHCIPLWPWAQVASRLSLRIQQLDIVCETKTQDAVFCKITITVLFRVMAAYCYEAHYRLLDPIHLIQSSVMDTLRTTVAKTLSLDALFVKTLVLANAIKTAIYPMLLDYGYEVMEVLVTNIRPDEKVIMAWTDVHVAKRIRQSLLYKAEADKIQRVKAAEAHAEELYLSGVGTALQRKALAQGAKNMLSNNNTIRESMASIDDQDVMDVLLMTQYYDMIESISSTSGHDPNQQQQQSLFVRFDPSFVNTVRGQISNFAQCKIPDLLS